MKIATLDIINSARKRVGDFRKLQQAGLICLDGDFFPSVHYPPITMYPPISEQDLFAGYCNPADNLFDIYAHIPFCIQRCAFCHYPVKLGELPKQKDHYLDTLEKEMDIYMHRLGLATIKARSILVGGGTPTYLMPDQLNRFLRFFTSRLDLTNCTQFSYDVDPPTLLGPEGMQRLKIMRSYGVNRLTIGVQSLNDRILKRMNRPHTATDAIKAIEQSRKAGFKINIEFIYGYPDQTLESWIENMRKAVTIGTEEIQLYRLKIIPYGDFKAPITRKLSNNPRKFSNPEQAIMMKQIAHTILNQSGYNENLRRVFSKVRKDYSHYADNQCCKLFDQIGFGLTAFSSLRDRFGLNTQDFNQYFSLIAQDKLSVNRGLVRNKEEQLRWNIILPLKNRKVYKKFFQKQTGISLNQVFRKKIERLKNADLLIEDTNSLMLSSLGGFFADEVCQQFHHPDYMPFPRTAFAHGELFPYDGCQPL